MTRSKSCSRNSILNSKTGKCKVCHSFSLRELQGIARKRGLSTKGDKEDLCYRILKKLGGDYTLYSSASSRGRSYSTKKKATRRKSTRKSKTSRKSKKSKTQKRKGYRARKSSSSVIIRVKPYRKRRLTKGQQRSTRYTHSITGEGTHILRHRSTYPSKGVGSFQSRHSKSTRKGPPMPAQSHRGQRAVGNDGRMWESKPDSRGVFRWRRL